MTIQFHCPTCKRKLRAPEASAGKKGKCPGCQKMFQVPAPVYEAEEARSSILEIDEQAPEYQPEIDEPENDGGDPFDETSAPVRRRRVVVPAMIAWDMLVLAGAVLVCISFVVPWWRMSETSPVADERAERDFPLSKSKPDSMEIPRRATSRGDQARLAREQKQREEKRRVEEQAREEKQRVEERARKLKEHVEEQVHLVVAKNQSWYIDHVGVAKLLMSSSSPIMLWGWNTGAGIMGLIFGLLIVPVVLVPKFVAVLRPWSWTADILPAIFGIVLLIMGLIWVLGAPSESVEGRLRQGIIVGPWLILVGSLLLLVGSTVSIVFGVMKMVARSGGAQTSGH
jgi:hypothetical protein